MSGSPAIELVGAGIARDPAAGLLIRDVSWPVAAGEFWVVTGAHGAGKSVLLETMAGVCPCVGGALRWFGHPVDGRILAGGEGLALRRRVGLVFEGGGRVFSQLSVAENIALPVSYHRGYPMDLAMNETAPLLAALALEPFAATPAGRINRVWMLRVALGRALALHPEVLLLDNPVAGMDPGQVAWWQSMLSRLAEGHPAAGNHPVTLVVSTDDARMWRGRGRQFAELRHQRWQRAAAPAADPGRGSGPGDGAED